MNDQDDQLPIDEVEARLRATLRARSHDVRADPTMPLVAATSSRRRVLPVAAAAAVVVVGLAAAVAIVLAGRDDSATPVAAGPPPMSIVDGAPAPTPACGTELPLSVTVPDATAMPASHVRETGQLVVSWPTPEGAIEFRWPARTPEAYALGTPPVRDWGGGDMSTTEGSGRYDVHLYEPGETEHGRFDPDFSMSRDPAAPALSAPCDVVEISRVTEDAQTLMGLRLNPPGSEFEYDSVDLNPRVIERRTVDAAPREAVQCQGADANGTPPNRYGDEDRSMGGPEPVDVLLDYLAANPRSIHSGYVEMIESDGSVTYGVEPWQPGAWTMLLHTAQGDDGTWYLASWTSSGC